LLLLLLHARGSVARRLERRQLLLWLLPCLQGWWRHGGGRTATPATECAWAARSRLRHGDRRREGGRRACKAVVRHADQVALAERPTAPEALLRHHRHGVGHALMRVEIVALRCVIGQE